MAQGQRSHVPHVGYPVDELLTKTFWQVTYRDDLAADVTQVELMREGKI
jgi:hypothetical protein